MSLYRLQDLRPLWRLVALLGIAWWLADRWLLAPAAPLPWILARPDIWGLPVQGLALAAAALLLARDRGTASLALIPLVLLMVSTLGPAPGVNQAPLAIIRYGGLLVDGTPAGILAGVSGFVLLVGALGGVTAVISGRLRRAAGSVLLAAALVPPLVQLLLHGLGAAPTAAGRLCWSLVASVMGFGLVCWSLPRIAANGAAARGGPWERRVLAGLFPAGALLAYVAVKLEAAGLSAGDENIYFYDVALFTRGLMPYRDYFFAHPPLHVVIPGLISMVTGVSLTLLKLLPLAASCVTGLVVWDTVRRPCGQVGAAAAMAGFLFGLEQLQASSNLTGVNLTVLFAALSVWCVVRNKHLAGGLMAGAAVSTGVYAAPVIAAVPLVLAFRDPKGLLKFLGGSLGLAAALNLSFRALAGPEYWEQVYLFHTLKPVGAAQTEAGWLALRRVDWTWLAGIWGALVAAGVLCRHLLREERPHPVVGPKRPSRSSLWGMACIGAAAAALLFLVQYRSWQSGDPAGPARVLRDLGVLLDGKEFLRIAYYHANILLAASLLPVAWVGARLARLPLAAAPGAWAPAALFLVLTFGSVAELAVLRETYSFYYQVLLLPAALAAGGTAGLAWAGLAAAARACIERRAGTAAALRRTGAVLAVTGLIWMISLAPVAALDIGRTRFPTEARAAGQWACYPWKDSFPDNPFGAQVRARAWRHCRIKGALEEPVPRYLWNKKHHFAKARDIGAYIAENTSEGETIAGASMTTPLLALLSGRDVAARFVDTNRKRFTAGLVTEDEFWEAVCRTPLRYVVASPRSMFTPRRMSRHPVIRRYFEVDRVFDVPALKFSGRFPLVLFRRLADEPDEDGYYCRWRQG